MRLGLALLVLAFAGLAGTSGQIRAEDTAMVSLDVDGSKITIRHFVPPGSQSNAASVLLIPGWPAVGDDVLGLGHALSHAGVHVFLVHPRGHGESEGEATFEGALRDVGVVWEWMGSPETMSRYRLSRDRMAMAGYSWGGGIALARAAQDASVQRVVAVAASDHGVFIRRVDSDPDYGEVYRKALESTARPAGPVQFDVETSFEELRRTHGVHDLVTIAPALASRDLLIVAGLDDDEVELEYQVLPFYRQLRASGAERVQALVVQDGHAFGHSRTAISEHILAWIGAGQP